MRAGDEQGRPATAFYCVADERYFLGAVAMLNSLRLNGHDEPIHVLDAGLRPDQRELIEPHATLVREASESLPFLRKAIAPLRHPAETMVLIDADMIVTRPLGDLVERARAGSVVAFRNDYERFFAEWGELLGLGELQRRPSICSGLVFLGGSLGAAVLELLDQCQRRVESEHATKGGRHFPEAFFTLDQDILNAIICARLEADDLLALEHRLLPNPPFAHLQLLDERRLRCAYPDGGEPYALHRLTRKPWLEPTYHDLYSRLLARLLLGDDVAVRVPERWVPRRLRANLAGRIERARVNARERAGARVRELLPEAVMSRIDRARHG